MKSKMVAIIIITIITVTSVVLSVCLNGVVYKVYDPRMHSDVIDSVNDLSERLSKRIPANKVFRYTIYTHADTIYRNGFTGQYLDESSAENYTIDDLDKMRRLRNIEFVYDDKFNEKGYALTNNYIIIKTYKYNKIILKAYIKKDPTNDEYTDFMYNGKVLTSMSSLHTFDAYTGEGISTTETLIPLMIEQDLKEKRNFEENRNSEEAQ